MQSIFRIISKILRYNSIIALVKIILLCSHSRFATLIRQCAILVLMSNVRSDRLATLVRFPFSFVRRRYAVLVYSERVGAGTIYARLFSLFIYFITYYNQYNA